MAAPTRLSGVEAPDVRPIDNGPAGSQCCGRHLGLGARRPVANLGGRHQTVGIGDVERGTRRCTDPRQIARVAAVVSPDHDHEIDRRVAQQGDHGILAILRRTADRVERLEVRAPDPAHRTARSSRPSTSLRSRAIPTSASSSDSRGRCVADRGPDRTPATPRPLKRARKASRSPPSANVIADDGRFAIVEHHEKAPAGFDRLRGRRLRFLVPHLAVDDRRVPAFGIPPDVLPDIEDRPAGRVDQRAAAVLELLQHGDRDAKGRQNDHVFRLELLDRAGLSLRNRTPIARSLSLT